MLRATAQSNCRAGTPTPLAEPKASPPSPLLAFPTRSYRCPHFHLPGSLPFSSPSGLLPSRPSPDSSFCVINNHPPHHTVTNSWSSSVACACQPGPLFLVHAAGRSHLNSSRALLPDCPAFFITHLATRISPCSLSISQPPPSRLLSHPGGKGKSPTQHPSSFPSPLCNLYQLRSNCVSGRFQIKSSLLPFPNSHF